MVKQSHQYVVMQAAECSPVAFSTYLPACWHNNTKLPTIERPEFSDHNLRNLHQSSRLPKFAANSTSTNSVNASLWKILKNHELKH